MTQEITEKLLTFFERYYREDIGELAQGYPKDKRSLYIEYSDLQQYGPDLADDWISQPELMQEHAEEALRLFDLPVDISLSGAHVRLTDTDQALGRVSVADVSSQHIGQYVALQAQIGKVTGSKSRVDVAAFECQRCGVMTRIPQTFHSFQEPHECQGCERQGPFVLNHTQSEWTDQRKVKISEPPEEQLNGSGQSIEAYCLDDLVDVGGRNGLRDKAGSRVTVLGQIKIDDTDAKSRGNNPPVVDRYMEAHAFVFNEDVEDEVNAEAHRDEVEQYALREDAIDLFKYNIDPSLTVTEDWEKCLEMAAAFIMGAPRLDPPGGNTVRGDLHMLVVSDPGMNKSAFSKKVEEISPRCVRREGPGMSSSVGLTAAAVQDDFGDGGWTLDPGALPRADKGHLIIDEIDKGPDGFMGGIHGALEGDQELKIDKAGIQATLSTRVGLLALGNPDGDSSFDPYEPITEQMSFDDALMSRFDLIVTMQDKSDESQDSEIARDILDSIDETQRIQDGTLSAENAQLVTREVPREIMKAWVILGREISPTLTEEAKDVIEEHYVSVRQEDSEGEKPPITARTVPAGWRIAAAFARVELSDKIEKRHAERAVKASKAVIGLNLDPDTGMFDRDRTTEQATSQEGRVKMIVRESQDDIEFGELVDATGLGESVVDNHVEKLKRKGHMIEPRTDVFRATITPNQV